MTEVLLLVALDGGAATLERDDGSSVAVPAAWLPEGAAPGAALRARVERRADRAEVTLEVVEGDMAPDRESVGG